MVNEGTLENCKINFRVEYQKKKILIIREVYLNLFFGNLPIKMSSKYDEKW